MEEPSLVSVRAKVARANAQRDFLDRAIKGFLDENPYRIVSKNDPETGDCVFWGEVLKEPDALTWGVLVGEFFHNLRSALDQLAWQLSLVNHPDREPSRRVSFPIAAECEWYESVGRAKICSLSEEAQSLIRALQPCYRARRARSDPLWMIQEMNNADKHRQLHFLAKPGITAVTGWVDFFEERGVDMNLFAFIKPFEHNQEVLRFPGPIEDCPEVARQLHITYDVAFDPEGPGRGNPVRYVLEFWGRYVRENVVPQFEKFFPPE